MRRHLEDGACTRKQKEHRIMWARRANAAAKKKLHDAARDEASDAMLVADRRVAAGDVGE